MNKAYKSGRQIVNQLMREKGISASEMARRIGVSSQVLSARLKSSGECDMSSDVLSACLRELGYALIAIPMNYRAGDQIKFVDWNRKGKHKYVKGGKEKESDE